MQRISRIRGKFIDPSNIRLSPHFLLSDFMGCHSIYTRGLINLFDDPDGSKLAEGKYLCNSILEPILQEYGPLSISYGYISPTLSKEIVKCRDPNAPSYHRWDKGAAADICIHNMVAANSPEISPIGIANAIDASHLAYSRMITYSESPFICIASQICEGNRPRKAFYENRYIGKPRTPPLYIRKSSNPAKRQEQARDSINLEYDWRGTGYPTYHGGGIKQYQHTRISKYTVLSDFLYSVDRVAMGVRNIPSSLIERQLEHAGKIYDSLLEKFEVPRISIIRGFQSVQTGEEKSMFNWEEGFALECKPPEYIDPNEMAVEAKKLDGVMSVSVNKAKGAFRVVGYAP